MYTFIHSFLYIIYTHTHTYIQYLFSWLAIGYWVYKGRYSWWASTKMCIFKFVSHIDRVIFFFFSTFSSSLNHFLLLFLKSVGRPKQARVMMGGDLVGESFMGQKAEVIRAYRFFPCLLLHICTAILTYFAISIFLATVIKCQAVYYFQFWLYLSIPMIVVTLPIHLLFL